MSKYQTKVVKEIKADHFPELRSQKELNEELDGGFRALAYLVILGIAGGIGLLAVLVGVFL